MPVDLSTFTRRCIGSFFESNPMWEKLPTIRDLQDPVSAARFLLVKKPENVVGPDRAAEIAKGMAILHGLPKGWIDLELELLASFLHGGRKDSAL